MNNFCKDLKKYATKITSYEENEMIPLTIEENKSYRKQKVCYICKREFSTDDNDKKDYKVRDHFHYTGRYIGTGHNICKLR